MEKYYFKAKNKLKFTSMHRDIPAILSDIREVSSECPASEMPEVETFVAAYKSDGKQKIGQKILMFLLFAVALAACLISLPYGGLYSSILTVIVLAGFAIICGQDWVLYRYVSPKGKAFSVMVLTSLVVNAAFYGMSLWVLRPVWNKDLETSGVWPALFQIMVVFAVISVAGIIFGLILYYKKKALWAKLLPAVYGEVLLSEFLIYEWIAHMSEPELSGLNVMCFSVLLELFLIFLMGFLYKRNKTEWEREYSEGKR